MRAFPIKHGEIGLDSASGGTTCNWRISRGDFKPGELGVALASHVSAPRGDILSVWPIWEQNIVIVTTQGPNVANALAREFTLMTAKGALPMAGHAKINGEVCRGVIPVHKKETSETLKTAVQWQEGEMAFVRKLGKSVVALPPSWSTRCHV